MKRRTAGRAHAAKTTRMEERGRLRAVLALDELETQHDVSPRLSGGDVDADWSRAEP